MEVVGKEGRTTTTTVSEIHPLFFKRVSKCRKKILPLKLYLNYWKHTSLHFKFEKPVIPKTKIFEALEIKEKLVMACELFVYRNKEFMVNKQAAQNPPLFDKEKSFLMTILAGLGNWKKNQTGNK